MNLRYAACAHERIGPRISCAKDAATAVASVVFSDNGRSATTARITSPVASASSDHFGKSARATLIRGCTKIPADSASVNTANVPAPE